MNFFQDSYSETSSTHNSIYSTSSNSQTTPPLSSTPTSTCGPISVPPLRPKKVLSLTAQEFIPLTPPPNYKNNHCGTGMGGYEGNGFTRAGSRYANTSMGCGGNMLPPNISSHCSLLNNATHNQLLLRQQQLLHEKHWLQKQQQEFAAATFAKQQLFFSTHPQDEIANSLKTFAILSACKGNEAPPSSEEVMQDFAANGYTSDELNKYHQYQATAVSNMQMLANSNPLNNNISNLGHYDYNMNSWLYNQQQYINAYSELWRQNFLNMLPAHIIRQAEAAASINMDYHCQNMRQPKRSHFKKEGQVAVRRCVFCENNNEPEAVVKSHAVRDSQGRVLCPKLRIYVCPICGASGDDAHTVKYCPQKPIVTMEEAMKVEAIRCAKTNFVQKPHQTQV